MCNKSLHRMRHNYRRPCEFRRYESIKILLGRKILMKTIILCASLIICCIGCMPQIQSVRQQPPLLETKEIHQSTYNIGQIQEKNVGESLITIVDAMVFLNVYDGYKAVKTYQPPDVVSSVSVEKVLPINEGSEWILNGKTKTGESLFSSDSFNAQTCIVSNTSNEFYGISNCDLFFIIEWPEKISGILKPSAKITKTKYKDGSFKQEFIYNGKSKDTIKLQYREYKDDLARMAFYQDLIYDLSESKVIGFRGMMIEVLEATNSGIKFIVKSKMD